MVRVIIYVNHLIFVHHMWHSLIIRISAYFSDHDWKAIQAAFFSQFVENYAIASAC